MPASAFVTLAILSPPSFRKEILKETEIGQINAVATFFTEQAAVCRPQRGRPHSEGLPGHREERAPGSAQQNLTAPNSEILSSRHGNMFQKYTCGVSEEITCRRDTSPLREAVPEKQGVRWPPVMNLGQAHPTQDHRIPRENTRQAPVSCPVNLSRTEAECVRSARSSRLCPAAPRAGTTRCVQSRVRDHPRPGASWSQQGAERGGWSESLGSVPDVVQRVARLLRASAV